MEEKSYVEFRLTVPDLSTPERIQDGRHARVKTHISKGSSGVEKMKEKSSVEFRLTVPDLSIPERIQDGRHARAKTAIFAPIFKLFFSIPSQEGVPRKNPTSDFVFFERGRGHSPKPKVCHFRVRTPASGVSIPMFSKVLNLIPVEFLSSDTRRGL